MSEVKLVKRVVCKKPFYHVDEDGKRFKAGVGSTINISPAKAVAFPYNLIDPEVLKAKQNAEKAIKDAKRAEATAKSKDLKGLSSKE